ncbi:MAG: signal peptide-containing protein, partial [Frankiaceae bacterium]|nr:signal peptide-containing protein [Frankiaceae bacterium]
MLHTCTASVVRSKHRDLIVTAAHCVRKGDGSGYTFVPGYNDGKTPYGVWRTVAAYGAAKWRHQGKRSTQRDWAFL